MENDMPKIILTILLIVSLLLVVFPHFMIKREPLKSVLSYFSLAVFLIVSSISINVYSYYYELLGFGYFTFFVYLINILNICRGYVVCYKTKNWKHRMIFAYLYIISIILIYALIYMLLQQNFYDSFSNVNNDSLLLMFLDFLYFSIVTFSTVGYGDIVPLTTIARSIVGIEILNSLILLVLVLNLMREKNENKNDK